MTSDFISEIRTSRPVDLYRHHHSGLTEDEFRNRCNGQPVWHSVDLGDVFVEGRKNAERLAREARLITWPDLHGKTVLDIGAFGGWFSFEAERRGAASVTAIDYYSWVVDWQRLDAWVQAERRAGRSPDPYNPPVEFIDEKTQPGRRPFDVACEALGSCVKPVLSKFENFEHDPFDLVLFLGVLYHCEEPFHALRKVASLTKDAAIIETLGVYVPGQDTTPLWEFYGDARVNRDPSTWWAPNDAGLRDMLLAAGFSKVEVTKTAPSGSKRAVRIWAHAWR